MLVTLSTDGLDTSFYRPEREVFYKNTFVYFLLSSSSLESNRVGSCFETKISRTLPRLPKDGVESNETLITVAILGKG